MKITYWVMQTIEWDHAEAHASVYFSFDDFKCAMLDNIRECFEDVCQSMSAPDGMAVPETDDFADLLKKYDKVRDRYGSERPEISWYQSTGDAKVIDHG